MELHKRKNIRLKEYNYTQNGWYFVTICTNNRRPYFGEIINNVVVLNEYGNKIEKIIKDYNDVSTDVINDFYQIMPNHIHIIIRLVTTGKHNIGSIVSGLKSKCTKELKIKDLWQKNYYERVVRDQKEYDSIVKYIVENPFGDKYYW
ncbi:MAG: transposase [Lachnospiraceae bacterium]|nr:transposase [Lachnospiraceae bacterium]